MAEEGTGRKQPKEIRIELLDDRKKYGSGQLEFAIAMARELGRGTFVLTQPPDPTWDKRR